LIGEIRKRMGKRRIIDWRNQKKIGDIRKRIGKRRTID
jgi:hypothetical protein